MRAIHGAVFKRERNKTVTKLCLRRGRARRSLSCRRTNHSMQPQTGAYENESRVLRLNNGVGIGVVEVYDRGAP